ncbi:MAG: DJ-1/PfpI family protein [Spirochaetaceae bacterium]|jgi:4-methyl-5(b-hydroxyethyl)-thiazole monophosphate biosynthesis|nr:DJ-1/PfpI family protein [Spirochaetaceae bacterium]
MAKKAVVFLADGFEEVEAVTPIDYLRRAGVELTTVSISGNRTVTGSHNIPVTADKTLAEAGGVYDALLLPGGGQGAANMAACAELGRLLREQAASGRIVAAICASPAVVLAPLGLIEGRRFTCYPGMEKETKGGKWSEDRVVIDGNIVTSRGAGTAADWAVALIGLLLSPADGEKLAKAVVLR